MHRVPRPALYGACLAPVLLLVAALVARGPAPAVAQESGPDPATVSVRFERVLSGLSGPVAITNAGDGSGRLFIVEKAGRILILKEDGLVEEPFLDIVDRVESRASERGLLGLAFAPDYESSGLFYVNYTTKARQGLGAGDTVVSAFSVTEDPDRADPDSEARILDFEQPYSNHNGGDVRFGPDGYLYIGTGDGGSGGDPDNYSQNPQSLLGKMLRIDVTTERDAPYLIPEDNPFVGDERFRDEIWAYGLRNPWRYAFDSATGDLYIGDVGQNALEEIDFQPADSAGGENYGWRLMEGSRCFNPRSNCNPDNDLVLPVAEYGRSLGVSITGGEVYRGERYPDLHGLYVYADYVSGRVWGLSRDEAGSWRDSVIEEAPISFSTFGLDEDGEIYAADYSARGPGGLFVMVQEGEPTPAPDTPTPPPSDTPAPTVPPTTVPPPTDTPEPEPTEAPDPLIYLPIAIDAEGE